MVIRSILHKRARDFKRFLGVLRAYSGPTTKVLGTQAVVECSQVRHVERKEEMKPVQGLREINLTEHHAWRIGRYKRTSGSYRHMAQVRVARCRVRQWRGPGFDDADVSIASPKIPYSGFSPVRLQGRNFRRGLPGDLVCHRPSYSLLPPLFLALCPGRCACEHLRASRLPLYPRGPRSGPGYAVPVHLHLIVPIRPTRGHNRIWVRLLYNDG
jgi:hypothetical protein